MITFCVGLREVPHSNSWADDLFAHGIGGGPADNKSRSVCTFSSLIIIYFKSNIPLYELWVYMVWYMSKKDYLTVKRTQNLSWKHLGISSRQCRKNGWLSHFLRQVEHGKMYLRRILLGTSRFLISQKEMLFMGDIFRKLWYSSMFNSSRPFNLTRFN